MSRSGQHPADDVAFVGPHLLQRRARIDVPEDAHRVRAGLFDDPFEQLPVEDSDAVRLDDDVRALASASTSAKRLGRGGIDDGLSPIRGIDVAVLLAIEGVGLIESDVVAAAGKVASRPR
jgi:hypothetical protein